MMNSPEFQCLLSHRPICTCNFFGLVHQNWYCISFTLRRRMQIKSGGGGGGLDPDNYFYFPSHIPKTEKKNCSKFPKFNFGKGRGCTVLPKLSFLTFCLFSKSYFVGGRDYTVSTKYHQYPRSRIL
jgi:hypothetical protein